VKSAILTDPLLKGASIEVTTVNGVVTLKGTVNAEPDIARAIEVTNTQRDVKGVQSELIVQKVK
jgi:hyperosmotically inducible protein